MKAQRQPRARYATKAVFARLLATVGEAGVDLDKRAIEFTPDGTVRFAPALVATPAEPGTWDDL